MAALKNVEGILFQMDLFVLVQILWKHGIFVVGHGENFVGECVRHEFGTGRIGNSANSGSPSR
jgi:hypothetical protein